jgi:hypothetical protein
MDFMIRWKIEKNYCLFKSTLESYLDILEIRLVLEENTFKELCKKRENLYSYLQFAMKDIDV